MLDASQRTHQETVLRDQACQWSAGPGICVSNMGLPTNSRTYQTCRRVPYRLCALLNRICRHKGSSDLLRDASCFSVLHVGAPDVVQNLCLADIDVTQDAADGGAQHCLVCCLAGLGQTRKALVLQVTGSSDT
jgi:hypothetical protein